MRLDDFALEIFVEKIRRAHGPETQRVVHALFAQTMEVLAEVEQFLEIARLERGGIRRLAHQKRFDEFALTHDIARVAIISLRVAFRMPGDLAAQGIVVVVQRQMSPALHHRASPFVGNDLQSMFRQLESPNDLRPQQAAHVRAVRVREVLIQAAADRGAADIRLTFEHQHLQTRARQIACGDQAIVAGPDDDGVEVWRRSYGAAQAGTLCVAPLDFRVASTAISNAFNVSARQDASCAADTNQGSRESGSHSTPSSCSTCAMAS